MLQGDGEARWPLAGLQTLKQHARTSVIDFRGTPPDARHPLIATTGGEPVRRIRQEEREPVVKLDVERFRLDAAVEGTRYSNAVVHRRTRPRRAKLEIVSRSPIDRASIGSQDADL